jgi:hypothetical protein
MGVAAFFFRLFVICFCCCVFELFAAWITSVVYRDIKTRFAGTWAKRVGSVYNGLSSVFTWGFVAAVIGSTIFGAATILTFFGAVILSAFST